jgi:YbaB/EbfC DNA-binding family
MKSSLIIASLVSSTFAFAPTLTPSKSAFNTVSSSLHLFGGGNKGGDSEKKGGPVGMMDQLAMFKKAQEMAQKKAKLDEELKQVTFSGASRDGKVKATFKFVPITNPLDPNPDYDPASFEFDDDFYGSASPEEIAAACKEAIIDGIEKTNIAVAEKYQVLQADLAEAFGQGKQ